MRLYSAMWFNEDRTNVHDDQKNGNPYILTDKLVQKIKETVCEDHRLTVDVADLRCFRNYLDLIYTRQL